MRRLNLILKRMFDIVASILAIVVLLPVWIGVSAAIKKESEGPVIFRQERRTINGRIFNMLKFRTMVVGAERMGTGLINYENDPRVTGVGRKLRDTSVDELVQLFNILKGDMSIVGPRPCVKYELGDFDTLNKRYKKRFEVKAGLTGLAQIKGRNNIVWDERVEFDNKYIDLFDRYGVMIDIKIILQTVVMLLKKEHICDNKPDVSQNDEEAAKITAEEIIRIAHIPD